MDVERDRSPRRGGDQSAFNVGDTVILSGLTKKELNAACGTVVAFDAASSRWQVRLGPSFGVVKVKADNLTQLPRLNTEGITP